MPSVAMTNGTIRTIRPGIPEPTWIPLARAISNYHKTGFEFRTRRWQTAVTVTARRAEDCSHPPHRVLPRNHRDLPRPCSPWQNSSCIVMIKLLNAHVPHLPDPRHLLRHPQPQVASAALAQCSTPSNRQEKSKPPFRLTRRLHPHHPLPPPHRAFHPRSPPRHHFRGHPFRRQPRR